MSKHVRHLAGGVVELSADFICAMAMFGDWKEAEAPAPKPTKTSGPVKAKKTDWKRTKRGG